MSLAPPPRRLGKMYDKLHKQRTHLAAHRLSHPRTWTPFEERSIGRLTVAMDQLTREIDTANRRFVLMAAAVFRRTPIELPTELEGKSLFDL